MCRFWVICELLLDVDIENYGRDFFDDYDLLLVVYVCDVFYVFNCIC